MIDERNSRNMYSAFAKFAAEPRPYGTDFRAVYLVAVAAHNPYEVIDCLRDNRYLSEVPTRGSYDDEAPSMWIAPKGKTYNVDFVGHEGFVASIARGCQLYRTLEEAGFCHVSNGRADFTRKPTAAQLRYVEDMGFRGEHHGTSHMTARPLPSRFAVLDATQRPSWDWRDTRNWPHLGGAIRTAEAALSGPDLGSQYEAAQLQTYQQYTSKETYA
jgi:hypothetical protein